MAHALFDGTDSQTASDGPAFAPALAAVQSPGRVHVYDTDGNLVGNFDTIQQGVNASHNGYLIQLSGGTYNEQVTIDGIDGLTIEAAPRAHVTIQAPSDLVQTTTSSSGRGIDAIVTVVNSTAVNISGVAIDGAGVGNTTDGADNFVGVMYRNASGDLENVTVTGVRDAYPGGTTAGGHAVLSGLQRGTGVAVDNDDPGAGHPLLHFTMHGGSISDFQKNGTAFNFADLDFSGVAITGGGAQTIIAQNGVQVSNSTGTIDHNTISGIGYAGTAGVYSGGVLGYGNTNLSIATNTITGSNGESTDAHVVGVFIFQNGASGAANSGGSVIGNIISGVDEGIDVSGAMGPGAVTIGSNSISGIDTHDFYEAGISYVPDASTALPFNLTGTSYDDYLGGGTQADTLNGAAGDDTLYGNGGDDTLIGGSGIDTVVESVNAGDATITGTRDSSGFLTSFTSVSSTGGGTDSVSGVEKIAFDDRTLALGDPIEVFDQDGHVTGTYSTLQDAVAAAGDGDSVYVRNGTYTLTGTLSVDHAISIVGESESGVHIDASGDAGYGIYVDANGVSLSNFTLSGAGTYGIKVEPGTTDPNDRLEDFSLSNVTVEGSGRSEIDLNGVSGATLTDVTANGMNTAGVGVAITDSVDVTIANLATTGNNWGSVGLYPTNHYYNQATDNIVFTGSYTHGEAVGIYDDDASATHDLGAVTFPPSAFPDGVFTVTNTAVDTATGDHYEWYFSSAADAETFAKSLSASNKSAVRGPDGTLLVADGMSIQAALEASRDGDTIEIAAGTFDENLTVAHDVTINGANQGVDGNGARGGETLINGGLNVTSAGVTIDGVEVTGQEYIPGDVYYSGITLTGNDFTLINSVLAGSGAPDPASETSVGINTGSVTGLDVHGNAFSGYDVGIYVSGGGSSGSIANNSFSGVDGITATGMGNGVNSESSHVTISDNDFTNIYAGVINLFPFDPDSVDLEDYVSGNTITGGPARPVQVYPTGSTHNFLGLDGFNETFNGDDANAATSYDGRGGDDHLFGSAYGDSLTGGSGDDVLGGNGGNDTLTGGAGSDTIDGGDGVDTAITDTPINPAAITESGGTWSVGNDTLSHVEIASDGTHRVLLVGAGGFDTIQSAIDASQSGDTILIASGTYTEQLSIDGKTGLTIEAVTGANVTVAAPTSLAVNGSSDYLGDDVRAVIGVTNSTDITISGISVDGGFAGDTTAGSNGDELTGIAYLGSSGTVSNVSVFDVSNSPGGGLFGLQHGSDLFIDGNGATLPGVAVTGSNFTDFQKTGVFVYGVDLYFSGNTITGIGATGLTAQNGMQVAGSSGSITGNTITGFGYNGSGPNDYYASGIIAYEPDGSLLITGNTITGSGTNAAGIDVSDTSTGSVTISGNTLSDLLFGIYAYTYLGGTEGLDNITIDGNSLSAISGEGLHFAPEESYGAPWRTGTGFTVSGSQFDDTLSGSDGNDHFSGLAGDDVLAGNGGNDTLDGGSGLDTATYASATAGVTVSLATTAAQNTGGAGTDSLSNIESVIGSSFNDTLTAAAVGSTLSGGDGNDTLVSGAGDDTLSGGNGSDTASYEAATSGVIVSLQAGGVQTTGGGGDDTLNGFENLTGGHGGDILIGNSGSNILSGNDGNDTLIGNDGNDTLVGGIGDDTLNGGTGTDTASYATAAAGVTISLAVSGAQATGGAGSDSLVSIENLIGSAFYDTLIGNSGNNVLRGGAGNDTLVGGLGDDTFIGEGGTDIAQYAAAANAVTVNLSLGAQNTGQGIDSFNGVESVIGSTFNDTLTGNGLANTLTGGAGDDMIDGGTGLDYAGYANAAAAVTVSLLLEGAAQNTGSAGMDTLVNIENLLGSAFNDTLTGDAGNNVLNGFNGNDTLVGGMGNDTLIGGGGIDTASYAGASAGVHVNLYLNTAQNTVGAGTDSITGVENVTGSAFADVLSGNGAVNIVGGGAGNDIINGSLGSDTLSGGTGQDRFQFTTALGASNIDTITDFTAVDDRIVLASAIFTALATGPLAAGAYNTGVAATQADDRIIYNASNGFLIYDADGVGGAAGVHFATLSAGLSLSAADFTVS